LAELNTTYALYSDHRLC